MTARAMKLYWFLGLGAALVLGAAAIWMGGLNQDEGWYLYAANLVAEGQLPYRDFFFTQGPVMPFVYSSFAFLWTRWGLLGARLFTLTLGLLGVLFAVGLARRFAPPDRRKEAMLLTFLLLATNLYHLYYLAIPKTYALAALFVLLGFYLLTEALPADRPKVWAVFAVGFAGLSLALAAGTRISLGVLLAVGGLWLIVRQDWTLVMVFALGGALGLFLCYGFALFDCRTMDGLIAAQQYHAARGGSDLTWTIGSLSRLVRWYLPVFILVGLGLGARAKAESVARAWLLFVAFLAVFVLQLMAPFPYEDYQVPVMALLAVFAAVTACSLSQPIVLLTLGLCFASSFGSPLLEKWSTNGQDRFWPLKKSSTELAQLQDVARRIERLDPGGKDLLTQDLYLAIETGRKVPKGLEMGPFAMLSDTAWKALLESAPCRLAALSGYTFAVEPPSCRERPLERQLDYWRVLKQHYRMVDREPAFGQNATSLLILERK